MKKSTKEKSEKIFIINYFKVIGIIFLCFMGYNLVDLAQAIVFNNTPIISYKTESDGRGGRHESGLLFNTYVYCNNEKRVEVIGHVYLRNRQYKGCEGEEVEGLVKTHISALAINDSKEEFDSYKFFTETLTGAIPTIERLYHRGDFTIEEAFASTKVINGIAQCDEKYKLDSWNSTEEFYDIWKDSKCRKKYMKKYKFE